MTTLNSTPSTANRHSASPSSNALLAAGLSLVIPGAGQIYTGARTVGLTILAVAGVLAFLIEFTLNNLNVAKVEFNGITTSWLWLLYAAFWIWNVVDAYQRAHKKNGGRLFAFAIPILIIYIIAWQVTNVDLVRLVTRFSDTGIIFNALIHPDLFTRDTEQQAGAVTVWVPCTPATQGATPEHVGYFIQLDRTCATVGDTVFVLGSGFVPNTTGNLYWSETGGDNEVQIRSGGQPVLVSAGADGRFGTSFTVPPFAGRDGLDPNNPTQQAVHARFVQEVGPPLPSGNFHLLIGEIEQAPAPSWMVSLGIVPLGATVPTVVPGKIFETIALGLMATLLSIAIAAPLSFLGAHNVTSRFRGGTVVYYIARAVFNIVRSIDVLIWAIILVVWVGLGAFAGLLALSIHSIAALAKLYSEEVEHIDPGPVEASTAAGATTLQAVRYSVVPQIVPPFLAYSLLRWDINMRSATIVGLVSAAGVGFVMVESIRKGGYEIYAAALWCIAIVVIIVDYVSSHWRNQILHPKTQVSDKPPVPFYKTPRGIIYTILFLVVFVVSWNLAQIDLSKLLEPAPTFLDIIYDYITIDTSPAVWQQIVRNMLVTIFQALLATTLGGLIALPFSFLAARNITAKARGIAWVYHGARFVLNFLRSIEALLYVAIFVFWVGIGAFAGMLALSITTFGLLGKLFSEAVENIEEGPVEAITATGATRLQSIVYAVLPQIVPPFISYAIYQWDINIRIATVIAFTGGGGIGLLFLNYTGQLQYHKAGAVVLAIVVVVTLMDFASARIRQKLV